MPAIVPIVIKDGAATPVDHTFSPNGINTNGVASWAERNSGIPVGYPTITWSLRAPTSASPTYKLQGIITVPKVVSVTDSSGKTVQTVDYSNLANLQFVFSERSTQAERDNLIAYVAELPLVSIIKQSLENVEPMY